MTRKTIDDLEMLNPYELGEILHDEVREDSPDFQYIKDLIVVGCPVDPRDYKDRTPFHWAAWYEHLEVVEFLLSKGADINARDFAGWTALHYVAHVGKLQMVELLISLGADVHSKTNDNQTAWNMATDEITEAFPELRP